MSHITIDNNKCKSCMLCVDVCPKKLIKKSNTQIGKTGEYVAEFIDTNNACLGCAQCAIVCPDIAIISVVKE